MKERKIYVVADVGQGGCEVNCLAAFGTRKEVQSFINQHENEENDK